jgi:hypothetical protein
MNKYVAGKKILAFLLISLLSASSLNAMETYRAPLTDMVFNGGFISKTGVLVFPGIKLADLDGYWFWGRMSGGHISINRKGFSNKPKIFPEGATGDGIQRIDFDMLTVDGTMTKALHIQLYNGEGGVWAKGVKTFYFNETAKAEHWNPHYTVDQNTGALSWIKTNNINLLDTIPTSYEGQGYGVDELGIAYALTTEKKLVFPNATVEMFAKNAERKISARVCGSYTDANPGYPYHIVNAAVTSRDGDIPKSLRFEAQVHQVKYSNTTDIDLKCAVVELTNGEGGVYARITHNLYKSNASLGSRFFNDDGSLAEGVLSLSDDVLPREASLKGYGVFNLEATDLAVFRAEPSCYYDKGCYLAISNPQLVFPGMKLAQLEKAQFYGAMDGNYVGKGAHKSPNCYSMTYPIRYPSSKEKPIEKLYATLSLQDGNDHKYVLVELTEKDDGVYAAAPRCCHRTDSKNSLYQNNPYSINEKGEIVLQSGYTSHTVAPSDRENAYYGIKQLGVAVTASTTDAYVFSGLKAANVLRGEILGKAIGAHIAQGTEKNRPFVFCNKVIEGLSEDMHTPTAFRVEGHLVAGDYDKVVSLRLSDGELGLEVMGLYAGYRNLLWGNVGRKFVNDGGTGVTGDFEKRTMATIMQATSYGVYDFGFALPDDALNGSAYAVWNGGDTKDAASWVCYSGEGVILDGVCPDKYTYITTSGDVVMSADVEINDYAYFRPAANSTIDTAGHKLTVSTLEAWPALTVTDTVGGGELIIDIPQGMESVNYQIKLSGKLKLVKKGEGCFVPVLQNQTYTGGNLIAGGKLMLGQTDAGTARYWGMGGYKKENETAQIVQIDEGGFFDINGNKWMGYMTTILNGGTIYGSSVGMNTKKVLTADSRIQLSGDFYIKDEPTGTQLNGHTLELAILGSKTLFYQKPWVGPGTVKLVKSGTGGGTLKIEANNFTDKSVNLIAQDCALNIQSIVDVNDYTTQYNANYNWMGDNAALRVHGAFTPYVDYFTGATMMDGSTINLSNVSLPWSAKSSFSNANQLKIANDANITLVLPEVVFRNGEREVIVVTNLNNNVDFDVSRITCDLSNVKTETGRILSGVHLKSSGTGLVVEKLPGLMLLIR